MSDFDPNAEYWAKRAAAAERLISQLANSAAVDIREGKRKQVLADAQFLRRTIDAVGWHDAWQIVDAGTIGALLDAVEEGCNPSDPDPLGARRFAWYRGDKGNE